MNYILWGGISANIDGNYMLMYDNAKPHTDRILRLRWYKLDKMAPKSLDLNPIEHVCKRNKIQFSQPSHLSRVFLWEYHNPRLMAKKPARGIEHTKQDRVNGLAISLNITQELQMAITEIGRGMLNCILLLFF